MLQPGQVLDRYTVIDELGRGGMAVVYRVRHNALGSLHALKVLTLHGASIQDRLVQEGRVQAGLRHPNIVAVTDVLDVDGSPGLVMELVQGPSLEDWLLHNKPDLVTAEALFRGVLAGVRRAHRLDLVHRDLKPGNVLLEVTEEGMIPKVADFGLAKLLETQGGLSRTRTGIAMGTPAYMAPEQIRDAKNVDARADIFSLGCILYELVVGASPFEGPDVLSIFNSVCEGRYVSATERVAVTSSMQRAIEGCLQVDRDQRLSSCDAVLDVLDGGDGRVSAGRPAAAGGSAGGPGMQVAVATPSGGPLPPDLGGLTSLGGSQVSLGPPLESPESLAPGQVSATPPPPPRPPPVARGAPPPGLWVAVVALGALGAVALGAALFLLSGEEESPVDAQVTTEVVEGVSAPVEAAPEPPPEPVAAPAPTPTSRGSAPKREVPRSEPEPEPEPVAPPEPQPERSSTPEEPRLVTGLRQRVQASWSVQGDALAVWLVATNGRKVPPGSLPAGTYSIKARFQSWDGVVDAGTVNVLPGMRLNVRCQEALLSCSH